MHCKNGKLALFSTSWLLVLSLQDWTWTCHDICMFAVCKLALCICSTCRYHTVYGSDTPDTWCWLEWYN